MKKRMMTLLLAVTLAVGMDHGVTYAASSVESDGVEESIEKESIEETAEEEPVWYEYTIYDVSVENRWLVAGESTKLTVSTNVPAEELVYESMNPSVATVTQDGIVTAVSGGETGYASAEMKVSWTNPENPQESTWNSCSVEVQNTISLDREDYTVYTGKKEVYQLKATPNPVGTVTWKSSDNKVATVDGQGIITPKKAGMATITATANGVSESCYVRVEESILTLSAQETVYLKNPRHLDASVYPEAKITWKSSNSKIANVNDKGVVTGLKKGTVTITATANGMTKKCKVTVKTPAIVVSDGYYYGGETKKEGFIFQGSCRQLQATIQPEDAKVTWKSSNNKIAKVDKNGNVTGVKAGTATITASIPGAKASYKIHVAKNPYKLSFTSRILMKGGTASIYVKNLEGAYVSFYSSDYNVARTEGNGTSCKIIGTAKGKVKVNVSFSIYEKGNYVYWNQPCTVTVLDTGISAQQFAVAKGTTKTLTVKNAGSFGSVNKVTWKSSSTKVAAVDKNTGLLKGKKAGKAKITAEVIYQDGSRKVFTSDMQVSDPKLKTTTLAVALGGAAKVDLKGTNSYSNIKWNSSKKSVLHVGMDGSIAVSKKGKAEVRATVDGKTIKCQVYISDPKLKGEYATLAPGGQAQITLTGTTAKSKITYKSSNKGVAVVDKYGRVTATGKGRSKITVTADGKELVYLVEVASQRALDACAAGYDIISRSTYSQALRMSEGYYDCSSLVFRAYGRDSGLLGGGYSWAPTAADMAKHMANTGKVIAWKALPVEELRPGDLIFHGNEPNGRYLGIYHVSMYYGGGWRLEKPLAGYYERYNTVMIARPVP